MSNAKTPKTKVIHWWWHYWWSSAYWWQSLASECVFVSTVCNLSVGDADDAIPFRAIAITSFFFITLASEWSCNVDRQTLRMLLLCSRDWEREKERKKIEKKRHTHSLWTRLVRANLGWPWKKRKSSALSFCCAWPDGIEQIFSTTQFE